MKRSKALSRAELEYDAYASALIADGISDPREFARAVRSDFGEAHPSLTSSLWNTAMLVGGVSLSPVSRERWDKIIASLDLAPTVFPAEPDGSQIPAKDLTASISPESAGRLTRQKPSEGESRSRDLITTGEVFQIRAEPLFKRIKEINREDSDLEKQCADRAARLMDQLPEGYSRIHYGTGADGESTFALMDPSGADVAYPLTKFEAFDRAWQHSGKPEPDDPIIQQLQTRRETLAQERAEIGREMDRDGLGLSEPPASLPSVFKPIATTFHEKRGNDVFIVGLAERVDAVKFREMSQTARSLRGNYSRGWKPTNAPAGFQFNTKAQAEQFIARYQPAIEAKLADPVPGASASIPESVRDRYNEDLRPGDFAYLGGGLRGQVLAINPDHTVALTGLGSDPKWKAFDPTRLTKANAQTQNQDAVQLRDKPFQDAGSRTLEEMISARRFKAGLSSEQWKAESDKDLDFPIQNLLDDEIEAAAKAVGEVFFANDQPNSLSIVQAAQERASLGEGGLDRWGELIRRAVQPLMREWVALLDAHEATKTEVTNQSPSAEKAEPLERPSTYLDGNRAEYTGEVRDIAGGKFYVVEMMEGIKAGQEAVTLRDPDGRYEEAQTQQHQQQWREQQEGFRRLHEVQSAAPIAREDQFLNSERKPNRKVPNSNPSQQLAEDIKKALRAGTALSSRDLYLAADVAFDGTQAAGVYNAKDAYDAVELAVNQFIAENPERFNPNADIAAAQATVAGLQAVIQKLPTQSVRTSESDEFQQFSTPPTLAYTVAWVANLNQDDSLLEPSAGIGGLAVWGKNGGVDKITVNELSSRRHGLLANMHFDRSTSEDAEHLNAVLPGDIRPTVVLMNPPFSSSAGKRQGERDTSNGARHIEQALARLEDGGRLVAIVGEGMALDRPTFRDWWTTIQSKYNVRANIGIDGRNYAKYGTTFDNQILVIDKTGPTLDAPVSGKVALIEELFPLLEGIRNERTTATARSFPSPHEAAKGGASHTAPESPAEPDRPTAHEGAQDRQLSNGPTGGSTGPVGSPEPAGRMHAAGTERSGSDVGGVEQPTASHPGQSGGEHETRRLRGHGAAGGGGLFDAVPDSARIRIEVAEGQEARLEVASATDAPRKISDSIFTDYAPSKVFVQGAQPHPTKLVESSAMASVRPPDPTYQPQIPRALLEKGILSLPQFETTVYAGQAHEQLGPDGVRYGFFIGDGTGVGKTREIASVLLDNFARNRERAVWISAKKGLQRGIKDDLAAMDAPDIPVHDLGKTKSKFGTIQLPSGILFSTFDTLRGDLNAGGIPPEYSPGAVVQFKETGVEGSIVRARNADGEIEVTFTAGDGKVELVHPSTAFLPIAPANKETVTKSRVDQIIEWFGPNYDGVVVIDEAHKAGNAVEIKGPGIRGSKKPSQQALAILELQRRLPNARVLYASATGATEVSNLAYADRLGIWGNGTAFATREAFISHIQSAGLSAMEIVARDLKAMGRYQARTLSWDGVEFDALEHPLTPEQTAMYDKIASAWQTVFANMNEVMDATGANNSPAAKMAARSAFFSSQQRFFNQLLTAMQMPTLLSDIRKNVDEGNAVLIQITNTNEAIQTRQLEKAADEERSLEEIDLSPRDILLQYLDVAFPTKKYQEITDGEGNSHWVLVRDSAGNPVDDPEALERKYQLMDQIVSLAVPQNPLEQIIDEFGQDTVAEITGRTQRVVWKEVDGERTRVVEKRSEATRQKEAQEFNDDKRRILIFSEAGGTGFSYHADKRFVNQRRRFHYLAQAGWRADNAVQGLGRGHRSNQASAPFIKLVRTDIEGHKRFISTIARRLAQLGALTSGERRATGQGLFNEHDNLENNYATGALHRMVMASYRGEIPEIPWEVFAQKMGFDNLVNKETGELNIDRLPPVPQFLNRLLILEISDQSKVFTAFQNRMIRLIDDAKEAGTYDQGMQLLHVDKGGIIEKISDVVANQLDGIDEPTRLVELKISEPADLTAFEQADRRAELGSMWVRNHRNGNVYLVNPSEHTETDRSEGTVHKMMRRIGIRSASWVKENEVDVTPRPKPAKVGDALSDKFGNVIATITALPDKSNQSQRIMIQDSTTGLERPYVPGYGNSKSDAEQLYRDHGVVVPGINDSGLSAYYVNKGGNYEKLSRSEAHLAWDAAIAGADRMNHRKVTFLTGVMLPVWDRLKLAFPKVYRTTLPGGETLLGVMIDQADVHGVRQRLGVGGTERSPEEVFAGVLEGNTRHELANGWKLYRARVAGEYRIEVAGVPPENHNEFTDHIGGFIERRDFRARCFIPTDPALGTEAIGKLLAKAPIIEPQQPVASDSTVAEAPAAYGAAAAVKPGSPLDVVLKERIPGSASDQESARFRISR